MNETDKKEEKELLRQLEVIGDNRWFLAKLFLICMTPNILNGLNVTSYVYLADVPDHWCDIPELSQSSWTSDQKRIFSSPKGSDASSCEMYDYDYSRVANLTFEQAVTEARLWTNSTVYCNQFAFATGVPSMVVDFDLVCGRTALRSTVQVALSLGKFLGALIFGLISDKFGRRTSFLCGSIFYIISGPVVAIATSYGFVIAGRIGLGAAASGIYHPAFVILSEIASRRKRASIGIVYNLSYPIGMMIVPILGYYFRNWRTLQTIIAVPAIFCLVFWWLMPESPMWLISKRRRADAAVYIRTQYNKLGCEETHALGEAEEVEFNQQPHSHDQKDDVLKAFWIKLKTNFSQLFVIIKYSELRRRLLVAFFIWGVLNFSYYGLALNVDNFKVNRYVYGFITGLLEAPSYILPLPLLKWMGRRYVAICMFYVAAFCLLVVLAIPDTEGWKIVLLIIVSVGRMFVSGVFAVCILQTTELFPTLLRNTAIGVSSMASHIGSMSAPLFVDLVGQYLSSLPSTIFGLLALTAGTLIFILPETKNKPLPNSIQDVLDGPKESRVGLHQVCR